MRKRQISAEQITQRRHKCVLEQSMYACMCMLLLKDMLRGQKRRFLQLEPFRLVKKKGQNSRIEDEKKANFG